MTRLSSESALQFLVFILYRFVTIDFSTSVKSSRHHSLSFTFNPVIVHTPMTSHRERLSKAIIKEEVGGIKLVPPRSKHTLPHSNN